MRFPRTLAHDRRGATAVEFALVAPAFLLMLLGVFQVGVWMQNYNAMRNAVAKTARGVAVEYQTENRLTDAQIANMGLAVASTAPFMLKANALSVEVTEPASQPFAAARQVRMTLTYRMPSFLGFAGINGPTLSYGRTMFLAQN